MMLYIYDVIVIYETLLTAIANCQGRSFFLIEYLR